METPQFNPNLTTSSEAPAENDWTRYSDELEEATRNLEGAPTAPEATTETVTETEVISEPAEGPTEQPAETLANGISVEEQKAEKPAEEPVEEPAEAPATEAPAAEPVSETPVDETPATEAEQIAEGQLETAENELGNGSKVLAAESIEEKPENAPKERYLFLERVRENDQAFAERRKSYEHVPDIDVINQELDRIDNFFAEHPEAATESPAIFAEKKHRQAIFLKSLVMIERNQADGNQIKPTDIIASAAVECFDLGKASHERAHAIEEKMADLTANDPLHARLATAQKFYTEQSNGYNNRGEIAANIAVGEYDDIKYQYALDHDLLKHESESESSENNPEAENALPGAVIG